MKTKKENFIKEFIMDETGDTNFISIAIVMVIILLVAGAFIAFKNNILTGFNTETSSFLSKWR